MTFLPSSSRSCNNGLSVTITYNQQRSVDVQSQHSVNNLYMKKHLIITSIFFCACVVSYSQTAIGIKAGVDVNALVRKSYNSTGMSYAPYFTSDPLPGLFAGGFARIPIVKNFGLQPELRLIQRGTGASSGSEEVRFLYTELPISLYYRPIKKLSLEAGAVFSYSLSGKISGRDYYDFFEPYTFGTQGGINFHVTDKFAVGATFYHGSKAALRQKFYKTNNETLAYYRYYNRAIQVSLTYTLFQKKDS